MKIEKFFECAIRVFGEDFAYLNPGNYCFVLAEVLPEEIKIGELNEFEIRAIIIIQHMTDLLEKEREMIPQIISLVGEEEKNEWIKFEMLICKTYEFRMNFMERLLYDSLIERFGVGKYVAFREGFVIVEALKEPFSDYMELRREIPC